MKARRVFGVVAISVALSACTQAEMKELEESDALENKAQSYCADTMGLAQDPKSLVQCKEVYIQGHKDGQKSN